MKLKLLKNEEFNYYWNKLKAYFISKTEGNESFAPKNHLHTISDIEEYSPNSIYGSFESTYNVTESTTVIPINIDRYEKGVDHLDVYINGLKLIEGVDYTDDGTNITLTKALGVIGQVHFSCIKLLETTASLESFKGDKGDSFTYSDFTQEQLEALKGEKGDTFTYYDLTESQIDEIREGLNSIHKKEVYSIILPAGSNIVTFPSEVGYREGVDVLFLYNKGVHLQEGSDYTITSTGVILTNAFPAETIIEAVITRNVILNTIDYSLLKGDTGLTPTIKAENGSNVGSVGTPTVTASTSGTTTTFTFDYLKGEKGDTGENGGTYTKAEMLEFIYPIGSIYMSVNNVSPASFFGGTWVALQDRFLIGAGNDYLEGETGGSATHTHTTGNHTLTVDEMPSHLGHHEMTVAGGTSGYFLSSDKFYQYGTTGRGWSIIAGNEAHPYTKSIGGGQPHSHGDTGESNNIPPYLAVYMWKRTA